MGLPQTVECVRQLFALFPAQATTERIEGYVSILADLDERDVAVACMKLAQVWDSTFPPPPAAIRTRAADARVIRLAQDNRPKALAQGPISDETLAYVQASRFLRLTHNRQPMPEEVDAWLAENGHDAALALEEVKRAPEPSQEAGRRRRAGVR